MESLAREKPLAAWFGQYTEMMQLIADMVGACSQQVYDGLQWNTNPAELIHIIRVSEMEVASRPGEAGDPGLSQLLHGDVEPRSPAAKSLPLMHIQQKEEGGTVDTVPPTSVLGACRQAAPLCILCNTSR